MRTGAGVRTILGEEVHPFTIKALRSLPDGPGPDFGARGMGYEDLQERAVLALGSLIFETIAEWS